MADIKVPKSVAKLLSSDESIIGKYSSSDKDMYATNKRLLLFKKQEWFLLFYIFGIIPGIIVWLLVIKSLSGNVEYSRVSGVHQKKLRSPRQQIIALVAMLICTGIGLFFIISAINSDIPESWWTGLIPIIVMLVFLVPLLRKFVYWQIELIDMPGKSPDKWRIQTLNDNAKGKYAKIIRDNANEFADIIQGMLAKPETS